MPVHSREDLGVGLLRSIERQLEPCLGKRFEVTYTAVFHLDASGWWFAEVQELPGCHTHGRPVDHARERIREAIAAWLDVSEGVRRRP